VKSYERKALNRAKSMADIAGAPENGTDASPGNATPPPAPSSESDRARNRVNSKIVMGLIALPIIYLLWMLAVFLFADDPGLIDQWPWKLIQLLSSGADAGNGPMVYLAALIYLVITSITANDENRNIYRFSLALVLTGSILSVALMYIALDGWVEIASSSPRYETDLGGENSDLFDADMRSFFGSLSIWYILLLGSRMGIRAKDIKGSVEDWIKNYLRNWVGS
jgi:hypothetical protein